MKLAIFLSFLIPHHIHIFATKIIDMNNFVSFNSVESIPDLKASAAFTVNSSEVFKEQSDIIPRTLAEGYQYMPWGADNEMPFRILELIESDETLSTCQIFNAEVCYGSTWSMTRPKPVLPPSHKSRSS